MLFLAVFCGFLAEYTLERKIEKDRERQFINLLKMPDQNNISHRPPGNPVLLDFSKQELGDFNFTVYSIKTVVKGMRRDSRKLLQQAANLLATINKSYHLE
jgi:hypothetical protein